MDNNRKTKKDFNKEQMYRKIMPSMTGHEQGTPPVRNLMEELVAERLDGTLKILQACDCERCRREVLCQALNQMPAVFAVATGEELERKRLEVRQKYETQAVAALVQAIRRIKERPIHS